MFGAKWRGLGRMMAVCAVVFFCAQARAAEDLKQLIADRTAVERVYYNHRVGEKPPFKEAVPATLIEKLVKLDLKKEVVLRRVYGMEITPEMMSAEVQRVQQTTRAPEVLAELQRALGGDAERFAETVARPIIVEKELRNHYENDNAIHAPLRHQAEAIREKLLETKKNHASVDQLLTVFKKAANDSVQVETWQMGARMEAAEKLATNGVYSVAGTVQPAQNVMPSTNAADAGKSYWSDLEPELQRVLDVQLRQAGDVSAVIETPARFYLFLALEKNDAVLTAASFTLLKRSYEGWLADQPDDSE